MPLRFVAVASGQGRVFATAAHLDATVREQLISVVVDRPCKAESAAGALGVPVTRIVEADNLRFSNALLDHCQEAQADFVFLTFNRLLTGPLLAAYYQRILNLHPALLPAFKGLRAVDETFSSGTKFLGSTFHFIDDAVDAGPIILQCVLPIDPNVEGAVLRRRQFEQMCKGFVQICHWMDQGRVKTSPNRVEVAGARYDQCDFSPALDAEEARSLVLTP